MTSFLRWIRDALPEWMRDVLSAVNQRTLARGTIRRKYGEWFDVDWRGHFRTMSEEEWKKAYDSAWRNRANDCVEETDVELILRELEEGGSVLDVGSGSGSLAIRLARQGFAVTGLDVSVEALRRARARSEQEDVRVEWREGFAEHLPFPDGSFDYVLCCHTLEHVKDLERAAAELKRVARKKVIVLVPKQKFKRYMENYHTQFFWTKSDLENTFRLESSRCEEIDCRDHQNEFQGRAFFYVGDVERQRKSD